MLENVKCLVISGQNIKTFNSNNRWVDLGLLDTLTSDMFVNSGITYPTLTTSLNYFLLEYTLTGTLADGSKVYQSEDLIQSMGVLTLENTTINTVEKLKVNVSSYLPKDLLLSDDKIYAYTTDTTFLPYVNNVTFSNTNVHSQSVTFSIDCVYNYNENIKYRYKINSKTFSSWSSLEKPYNKLIGEILPSELDLGSNTVTFEISNEDNSKVTTKTLTNAITVSDSAPQVIIYNADSDSFKLHFKVIDPDVVDGVSYRLLMNNTKYTDNVLVDWTPIQPQPVEYVYYIDTSKVVIDGVNTITIEYKDNYNISNKTYYTFTGKYKNIVFTDTNGEYYTTDKGVVLKILDLKQIIAGSESSINKITLKNNSTTDITNLTLNVIYRSPISGAVLQLSKTSNPFIPLTGLDYGSTIFKPNDAIDFYVKLDTTINASGLCVFDIDANAISSI